MIGSDVPPVYTEVVNELAGAASATSCSVYLYGSALWGDCTLLADGRLISDVDLLVVGGSLSELCDAARRLDGAFSAFRRDDSPLFRLGLKLRMPCDLAEPMLTINEVLALVCGKVLSGRQVRFREPGFAWLRRQARLVVPTRLQCNTSKRWIADADPESHRYLSARTLLEIPTVVIRDIRDIGCSYTRRLEIFEQNLAWEDIEESTRAHYRALLFAALAAKLNPENHTCGTLDEAEENLARFAAECGVAPVEGEGMHFWTAHRPLDVRDWNLRQSSA